MHLRPVVCAALAVIALTSGCSSDTPTDASPAATPSASATAPAPTTPTSGTYVAIGDSYTAGPGIEPLVPESGLCLRSTRNFPSVLATRLSTALVDVSCSGATTTTASEGADGLAGVLPPQLDSLAKDTDLVTVGLGGNDGGLFQDLLGACSESASACQRYVEGAEPAVLATTTDSVAQVLDDVAPRSPDATVVLVGYLRLSPETGSCDALGIDGPALDTVRASEAALDDALASAARQADVTYVSMQQASVGHDACAGAGAWTNGATTSDGDGIVFHPTKAGMEAVATAVAAVL